MHKGSLSCSAQPCNACKRQELPYSHSLNRLLSPSWLGSCSHSRFNPWEQRHDSKRLFTHQSGLPSATSSSFSPPFLLVCWVQIFFFIVFFLNPGSNQDTPSLPLCLPVSLAKKQHWRAPSSSTASVDLRFPRSAFLQRGVKGKKESERGRERANREEEEKKEEEANRVREEGARAWLAALYPEQCRQSLPSPPPEEDLRC